MDKKYLIILGIICIACFSIFFYQFTNSVDTFIVINKTEVSENGTVTGFLMDAYARGIENKSIFKIENVKNMPESGSNNYYGDISFKGEGEFNPCVFEHNITIKS